MFLPLVSMLDSPQPPLRLMLMKLDLKVASAHAKSNFFSKCMVHLKPAVPFSRDVKYAIGNEH